MHTLATKPLIERARLLRGHWNLKEALSFPNMASSKQVNELFNSGFRFAGEKTVAGIGGLGLLGHSIYGVWTSTFLVHGKPHKRLGEKVEFGGLSFEVPTEYRPEKYTGLILDYQSIKLEHGNVTGKVLKSIDLSPTSGWYHADELFEVPSWAESTEGSKNALFWYRTEGNPDAQFIGLLVRHDYEGMDRRRYVYAIHRPDSHLSIVTIEPETPKELAAGPLLRVEEK